MNRKNRLPIPPPSLRLLCVLATAGLLPALQAAAPPQENTAVSPVQPAIASPSSSQATTDPDETEWKFVTRLTLQATYDDNIFILPRSAVDDYLFHVAPTFAYGIGHFRTEIAPFAPIPHLLARTGEEELPHKNFAYASYTPDAVFYSKHSSENDVNHDVRIAGREEHDLWSLQGQVRFQRVTDANIDVGHRLRETYYTLNAGGDHELSGKTKGSFGFAVDRAEFSGGFASTDLRGSTALDYQVAPKTLVGLGATVGYLAAESSADQTYQQPLLRLNYQPTAKLNFLGEAGEEFRQFKSGIDHRSQFIFGLTGGYQPNDGTLFTLSSRRQTETSAQYAGENIVEDRYQGALRQRVLQRVYLGLAGGFVRNNYEANRAAATVQRRDNYYFGKTSLSRDLTTRGTIELSYEYRENDSTVSGFHFRENLTSLAASVLF